MSSPNFNDRKLPISILVLHYTGMESGEAAKTRLCDPAAEVSAHWLVHEDGRVESLVPEEKRAWHAGRGSWNGITDLNSASIGVEIVFPWSGLAAAGVGIWPGDLPEDDRVLFEAGDRDRGISIIQRGLADLGYGACVTGCLDETTQAIIRAVQRRYRPSKIDGLIDMQVMEVLKRLSGSVQAARV